MTQKEKITKIIECLDLITKRLKKIERDILNAKKRSKTNNRRS